MKRLFIGLLVLALSLSLAGAALAAVPKTACINWDGYNFVFDSFVIKNMGNIKTLDGPVKAYSLTGWHGTGLLEEIAVNGSGYVGTDGLFHFNYTGSTPVFFSGGNSILSVNGTIDTNTGLGSITFSWMDNTAIGANVTTGNVDTTTITAVNTNTAAAPLTVRKDKQTPTTRSK
jgi:hypothetical protein